MPGRIDNFARGRFRRLVLLAILVLGATALASPASAASSGTVLEVPPIVNLAEPDEESEELAEDEGEEPFDSAEVTCAELEAEEEAEAEEDGEPEEPCEEDDEGQEEGALPAECLLRTATARVFAQSSRHQVGLVVGYTSLAPAKVIIDYRFKGAKGGLKVASTTRRFARQGVIRLVEQLNDSRMAKALAARSVDVRLRIPVAPRSCGSRLTQHLTSRRSAHGELLWVQSKRAR